MAHQNNTMSILDEILVHKRTEVAHRKATTSLACLQANAVALEQPFEKTLEQTAEQTAKQTVSLRESITNINRPFFIAEIKRASPSKGQIRPDLDPVETARAYAENGASAISVLTDEKFFSGHLNYLRQIKEQMRNGKITSVPLLCKDFLIDPYQLWEARAYGADLVLLIVAALPPEELQGMLMEAKAVGLEVLVEIHDAAELATLLKCLSNLRKAEASFPLPFVGINNRNLHSFEVDINTTVTLTEQIRLQCNTPCGNAEGSGYARSEDARIEDAGGTDYSMGQELIVISESGLTSPETVAMLYRAGASGFLIGEHFVRSGNPGENLRRIISQSSMLING